MTTLTNGSTYTTATELIDSEYISRVVAESLRESSMALRMSQVEDISSLPTRVVSFAKDNSYTATTKSTDDEQIANTAYNPTQVQATAVEIAAMSTLTDMLRDSSTSDPNARIANEILRSISTSVETAWAALLDTFTGASQNVGTTTANLTALNLLEALKNLKINALDHAMDGAAFVLHPAQIYDAQAEGFTATANQGNAFSREDIVRLYGTGGLQQLVGEFSGVPMFSNSLVPTANSAADRAGALIARNAIGAALKWAPRVETQRAIVNGYNATAIFGVTAVGFVEVDDLKGVSVITDA